MNGQVCRLSDVSSREHNVATGQAAENRLGEHSSRVNCKWLQARAISNMPARLPSTLVKRKSGVICRQRAFSHPDEGLWAI